MSANAPVGVSATTATESFNSAAMEFVDETVDAEQTHADTMIDAAQTAADAVVDAVSSFIAAALPVQFAAFTGTVDASLTRTDTKVAASAAAERDSITAAYDKAVRDAGAALTAADAAAELDDPIAVADARL
ncbi:MAG: hypothetical protein R3C19_24175, partial [Planctomycetaceae bacterium]